MEELMVTLDAKQAISQLTLIREDNDKNSDPYWLYAFRGKTVLLREKAAEDLGAGLIRELNIIETTRKIKNSEGEEEDAKGWAYAGHITLKQLAGVRRGDMELAKIEREMLTVAPAVDDVKELA